MQTHFITLHGNGKNVDTLCQQTAEPENAHTQVHTHTEIYIHSQLPGKFVN